MTHTTAPEPGTAEPDAGTPTGQQGGASGPPGGRLRQLGHLVGNLRQSGIFLALVAIVVLFAVLTDGVLLSSTNVTNLVLQYSYILVLAIGMVIVIIAGHIDLSVGSVVALTGAVSGVLVIQGGMPWPVGVAAALAVGIAVGAWHGFWVAYMGIPAFIVTLAGMLLFRGLTLQVLDNVSLSPFPDGYSVIASGFINGLLGGYGYDAFTLLVFGLGVAGYAVSATVSRRTRRGYGQDVEPLAAFVLKLVLVAAVTMAFAWRIATSRGLPVVLVILAVLVIVYALVTRNTVFGRQVYALGGNLSAARLSGVNTRNINFWVFVNMGFLSGVAGVIYSSRSNGAQPGAGNMFELDAIAAAFIGGAAVTGGVGTVVGAMVGGLIMAVMSNGMQLLGIEQPTQSVVRGLVLLAAVAFDVYTKRRAGVSR
ncbi:multiple monosaccharide ABC transporter permease [Pseudokineococcus sp. 5B2Z-1]|uniref:multiple monosaccharide ABC transporter permease n=1 Tax=Pseudokineococcus sp. 5B2Z-1 TaxID=3132744 RepID=UPI0030AF9D67